MFENRPKSRIQHCERSELRLHYEWTNVYQKCQKMANFGESLKPEAYYHTVLPDRSILIRQKVVGNAKIEKFE